MSAFHAEVQLGEYARKCVEIIRSLVPGHANEVEPAVKQLAAVYATQDKDTVEERFKEEYRVYKAAADTIAVTNRASTQLNKLIIEGKAS